MHVDLTAPQRELQLELRDYFSNLMTPEVKASIRGAEEGENKPYNNPAADAFYHVEFPPPQKHISHTPISPCAILNPPMRMAIKAGPRRP